MKRETLEQILGVTLTETIIDPQLLNNDHLNYQRRRIEARVQEIMLNNSPAVSPPIVGQRDDMSHWIINGQHHVEAAVRRDEEITIYFFDSDGPQHEAVIFHKFQDWQKSNV